MSIRNSSTHPTLHPTLSIVIVCMNNLDQLINCLNSIIINTNNIKYEIIVVAYLFSKKNLIKLKGHFPDLKIIQSNVIRGFAENNNLALNAIDSQYCLILNDDVFFEGPTIEKLCETFIHQPKADFVSPMILNVDGTVQSCGIVNKGLIYYLFHLVRFEKLLENNSIYTFGGGIFKTYGLIGAAFIAKTNVFRELGFFDESYFFCPEDTALADLANRKGYRCYVNTKAIVTHVHAQTSKRYYPAIAATTKVGIALYLNRKSKLKGLIYKAAIFIASFFKYFYWVLNFKNENSHAKREGYINTIKVIFANSSPKKVFCRFASIAPHSAGLNPR